MTDDTTDQGDTGSGETQQKQEQTFTQAEVEKIVRDRLAQQAKNKFGDYDELRTKAEGAKTLEERLAEVETRYKESELRALRSDIAAKFQLGEEDRDLFLTGADEETLTAQAQRLAQRESDRKKQGNIAPNEGDTKSVGKPEDAATREFAAELFGGSE